jgi:uncharacterized spore protein YtfJ
VNRYLGKYTAMKTKEILQQLADKFSNDAQVKSVFGAPIEAQGKTIIPVAKIAYGLGAGGSQGGKEASEGEAGGGGGGMAARPVGVLEVTSEETRFVSHENWLQKMQWLGVGMLIGIIFYKWTR